MEAATFPPTILDGSSDFQLDPTLAENGEAVLNIRSVYDFDGAAVADINALADPAQTLAADRPARFLRIVKAVSQPDDDLLDIDNTAFGVSQANGMREIVGYSMIEPDGSVMVKVPANTALQISVLDENGKRITPRHRNWISLVPGQELECNGCHVQNSGLSHGRRDAFDSAWAGAQTAGVEFPNTDPRWFVGDIGETMAEVRARVTCTDDGCSSLRHAVYRPDNGAADEHRMRAGMVAELPLDHQLRDRHPSIVESAAPGLRRISGSAGAGTGCERCSAEQQLSQLPYAGRCCRGGARSRGAARAAGWIVA
jgi:hypothetical protein